MNWRIAVFCILGGLCFTAPAAGAGNFGWWYLAGLLTTAALVPVVRCGSASMLARFAQIASMLVVIGLLCTMSEAVLFYPERKNQMITGFAGGAVLYIAAAAMLAGLATILCLRNVQGEKPAMRAPAAAVGMVLLAALAYLVYYEIFGAIVFQLFTKVYYPHAAEQVGALGVWFFLYQIARGLIMTLAVLPVIYSLRLPRAQAAVVVGLLVWVIGGLAPLVVPSDILASAQRYYHMGEIFTQNFTLGVTATLLLRRKSPALAKLPQVATVV